MILDIGGGRMNKVEANKRAKEVFDEWIEEKEAIEKKAKADGTWNKVGLDSNNHLFKEVDKKAKEKLDKIKSMIDEQ